MVAARFTCLGVWCVCVLPLRVLLRSSAQLVVTLYTALLLALALVPIAVGVLVAVSDARGGALAPSATAQLLFVAGCTMVATAVSGCCAACSPPWQPLARRSLCLMILFTLIALIFTLLGTSIAFMRAGIIRSATIETFIDATGPLRSSLFMSFRFAA